MSDKLAMTAVDPRVQRARELLAGTIRADHESEEARSTIHDLLALVDESVPKTWHGLMAILDEVYPETTFPTLPDGEDRDLGPRLVSLLRRVDTAEAEVGRLTQERAEQADEAQRWRDRHTRLTEIGKAAAAVTPCSCSAQRARAEAAEKERDELRAVITAEAEQHRPDTCESVCTVCWQDWPCPIVEAAQ